MNTKELLKHVLLVAAIILLPAGLVSCHMDKTPLVVSVAELKESIYSDQGAFRMVYIYDSECNSCEEQLVKYAQNYLKGKNNDIHHYIVAESPNHWEFHSDTLQEFIDCKEVKLLAIDDTNDCFTWDDEYMLNIIKQLISDTMATLHDGTPQSFFLSPENKLLRISFSHDEGKRIFPCAAIDVADYNVSKIDFNKIIER